MKNIKKFEDLQIPEDENEEVPGYEEEEEEFNEEEFEEEMMNFQEDFEYGFNELIENLKDKHPRVMDYYADGEELLYYIAHLLGIQNVRIFRR